jgi:hypothetical protein
MISRFPFGDRWICLLTLLFALRFGLAFVFVEFRLEDPGLIGRSQALFELRCELDAALTLRAQDLDGLCAVFLNSDLDFLHRGSGSGSLRQHDDDLTVLLAFFLDDKILFARLLDDHVIRIPLLQLCGELFATRSPTELDVEPVRDNDVLVTFFAQANTEVGAIENDDVDLFVALPSRGAVTQDFELVPVACLVKLETEIAQGGEQCVAFADVRADSDKV